MTRAVSALAIALLLACQTQSFPAGRVTGILVTPDGEPIENAFVELHLSVPVGVDGGELEELGSARSRLDGTYEIAFPETRVLVNYGGEAFYGMGFVHPEKEPIATWFDEVPTRPIRFSLDPRAPGRDPIKDDCDWLCMSRLWHQCKAISLEYFGSEGVCDFLY